MRPFGMLGAQPGGYQLVNAQIRNPDSLPRAGLGLSPSHQGVQLVSLGGACNTKMAFDAIGRGQETLPFDWMCTRIEGIIGFLRNDFQGFFDFTDAEPYTMGDHRKFTVYRGAAHSWWHDDPTNPECKEKYTRRIQRLKGFQAHSTPILFVRVVATTDELPMVDTLVQTLHEKFGRESKLLLIIPGQAYSATGPCVIEGMPNLLVYLTTMGASSEAISAGLSWVSGQQPPNCGRSQTLASIPGLAPDHTGLFGMGGLPAFDNIPAHVPRPPRSDGKPNIPMPSNTKPTPSLSLPAPPASFPGMVGQQTPVPCHFPQPTIHTVPENNLLSYVPRPSAMQSFDPMNSGIRSVPENNLLSYVPRPPAMQSFDLMNSGIRSVPENNLLSYVPRPSAMQSFHPMNSEIRSVPAPAPTSCGVVAQHLTVPSSIGRMIPPPSPLLRTRC